MSFKVIPSHRKISADILAFKHSISHTKGFPEDPGISPQTLFTFPYIGGTTREYTTWSEPKLLKVWIQNRKLTTFRSHILQCVHFLFKMLVCAWGLSKKEKYLRSFDPCILPSPLLLLCSVLHPTRTVTEPFS